MVKADIINILRDKYNFTPKKSKRYVNEFIALLKYAIKNEEELLITNLGKFKVIYKNERPGINPKTGKKHTVSARKSIVFYTSPSLKTKLTD